MTTREYENRFISGERGQRFEQAVRERARNLGVDVHLAEASQVGDDLAVGTYVRQVLRCTGDDAALDALERDTFEDFDGRRVGDLS